MSPIDTFSNYLSYLKTYVAELCNNNIYSNAVSYDENYKKLVKSLIESYESYDEYNSELTLADINFDSLLKSQNIENAIFHIKKYMVYLASKNQELQNKVSFFTDEPNIIEEEKLAGERLKIINFMSNLINYFLNYFSIKEMTHSDKYKIAKWLWEICSSIEEDEEFNDNNELSFLNKIFMPNHGVSLGELLNQGYNYELNGLVKNQLNCFKNRFNYLSNSLSSLNSLSIFLSTFYSKKLSENNIDKVVNEIQNNIYNELKNNYQKLVGIAKDNIDLKIKEFFYKIQQNIFKTEQEILQNCIDLFDYIEKADLDIENYLFHSRIAMAKSFHETFENTSDEQKLKWDVIFSALDEVILKINDECKKDFRTNFMNLFENKLSEKFSKTQNSIFNTVKTFLYRYKDFNQDENFIKAKKYSRYIRAVSSDLIDTGPVGGINIYVRQHRISCDTLVKEMNIFLYGTLIKENEERHKAGLRLKCVSYNQEHIVDFESSIVYKTLVEIEKSKLHKFMKVALATKYNYNNGDFVTNYFAIKINEFIDIFKSLTYDSNHDVDISSYPNNVERALGAKYLTSTFAHRENHYDMSIFQEMVEYRKDFFNNPNKYILKSEALFKSRLQKINHELVTKYVRPLNLVPDDVVIEGEPKDIVSSLLNLRVYCDFKDILKVLTESRLTFSEVVEKRVYDIINDADERIGRLGEKVSKKQCIVLYKNILRRYLRLEGYYVDEDTDRVEFISSEPNKSLDDESNQSIEKSSVKLSGM